MPYVYVKGRKLETSGKTTGHLADMETWNYGDMELWKKELRNYGKKKKKG